MAHTHPARGTVDDDAIDLLLTDQVEIAELFERYDALAADHAPAGERETVAEELCSLLLVHATVKEEILYPAVREVIDEEYLLDEALVALDGVRSLIDDIQAGDPTEPRYDAQVTMLHELVVQHFEEERTQLFPKVRTTSLDLEELGAEIGARQELLLSDDEDAQADAP
jgi:hemerythrin superfamily protein